ncbi:MULTISPECIES: hypothetical protein [unclassified Novosphingobium]|uniref:hypothetical protein n=1 Tax=unclassified Novosphingobium TaxID=2644732 RepID=UPI001469D6A9|nr:MULTISPECIES: hypothetical protein [unclassified Novosphingobium]NMN05767.1 hypothetical protein [Novosphingobium sp. SG919]NMN87873.1 hypothetical protein [Novosphingobium sp. SG916]
MSRHFLAATAAAPLALAVLPTSALACASCGCTFTSDWLNQGLVTQPGQAVTLRLDYVPQSQLRTGTTKVDTRNIDIPNEREIERWTDNVYVTASYDRQFANDWGFNVSVPFIIRPHATIAEDTDSESRSRTHGLGDIRLMARWQGLSTAKGVTGLQFGLVLPTGAFHQTFRSGPAQGEEVDRGLQPGTGTTQAVIGAYHYRRLGQDFALMLQAQAQIALNARQDYRPGTIGEGSVAVQWLGLGRVVPQLQVNARINAQDSGLNADVDNSGGEQVYLAPGLTAPLAARVSAFAHVQLPLYQRVIGWQLAPRVNLAAGLTARF